MNGSFHKQGGFIVLAGIPWLAGAIGGLFTSLFLFAAKYVTKRLAVAIGLIGALALATASAWALIDATLAAVGLFVPAGLASAAAMFAPGNLDDCLTAYATVRLCCWAYDWNVRIIQYKLF